MRLTLKPLGAVDAGVLRHLRDNLKPFGEVAIAETLPLPADAYDKEKRQYRATRLFDACASEAGDRVLGVTEADLCEGELGSVFGYAQIGGHVAVISTSRLQGRRRTLLARTARLRRQRFLDRCVKEAVHELGHTLGLSHDDKDPRCVMHYSERLADTDRKGRDFCDACAPRAQLTLRRLGT